MNEGASGLIPTLLGLPIFHTEWVLWLLIGLSILSVGVIVERLLFYSKRAVPIEALRREVTRALDTGDFEAAAKLLARYDGLESNVVLTGLQAYEKGPESVEDLMAGALGEERARFETRLQMLATLAS